MTYELAKKLKDAGFPKTMPIVGGLEVCVCDQNIAAEPTERGCICIRPTLSELIKACGQRFGTLDLASGTKDGETIRKWCASEFMHYAQIKPIVLAYANGYETPEEAVANLWLELNKNA